MKSFYEEVVFITGAASGIGRELAEQLVGYGATVIATDVDAKGVERLADELSGSGGRIDWYRLDVTDYHAVRLLVQRVADQYGRIDYAFCNAGIGISGAVQELTSDEWERLLAVNLNGVIFTATEVYRHMARQGYGHIVNTASMAGTTLGGSRVPYQTTRQAVVAFSRALRAEGQQLGIRVTAFCPEYEPVLLLENGLAGSRGAAPDLNLASAVEQLLNGVEFNRELVEVSFSDRLFAWMNRFTQPIMRSVAVGDPAKVRKVSTQPETEIMHHW
ncbi:SDR family NAD(P)-dependent oxidoreductase [Larkinella soli]|uniref:SDR family NAD(P)-dependent oxidoreductase n=1 Tax=Larkinella soli TaxID=1770527 RepID=UPI000FFB412B|nr:SDR family oxidoreductase [Larkinella soli]